MIIQLDATESIDTIDTLGSIELNDLSKFNWIDLICMRVLVHRCVYG